jgi:cytochrome c553
MKKVFKWIGIILGVLIVIVIVTVFVLVKKADKMMVQTFDIRPTYFTIESDSNSIRNGAKFANLCKECHGMQFEGYAFFNEADLGKLYAPNLTKGKGSAVLDYDDVDWIRSIRHGVRPNGEGLMIMPSKDFYAMSKKDIGDLVSYLKTIPPVDHEHKEKNYLTTLGKVLLSLGQFGELYGANEIDHNKPAGNAPAVAASVEYGDYMVKISGCRTCHGEGLNGARHPNPKSPLVPNLTKGGNLAKWSDQDFLISMRTGKTPEGKQLDKLFMPYPGFAGLGDEELTAIFRYLQALPAKPAGK